MMVISCTIHESRLELDLCLSEPQYMQSMNVCIILDCQMMNHSIEFTENVLSSIFGR